MGRTHFIRRNIWKIYVLFSEKKSLKFHITSSFQFTQRVFLFPRERIKVLWPNFENRQQCNMQLSSTKMILLISLSLNRHHSRSQCARVGMKTCTVPYLGPLHNLIIGAHHSYHSYHKMSDKRIRKNQKNTKWGYFVQPYAFFIDHQTRQRARMQPTIILLYVVTERIQNSDHASNSWGKWCCWKRWKRTTIALVSFESHSAMTRGQCLLTQQRLLIRQTQAFLSPQNVQIPRCASYDWPAKCQLTISVSRINVCPAQLWYEASIFWQMAQIYISNWTSMVKCKLLSFFPLGFFPSKQRRSFAWRFHSRDYHICSHNTKHDQLKTQRVSNGPLDSQSYWRFNKFQPLKIEKETIWEEIEKGQRSGVSQLLAFAIRFGKHNFLLGDENH